MNMDLDLDLEMTFGSFIVNKATLFFGLNK